MDRGLKLDDTRLNLATTSTHRPLVLLDRVDTGDNKPVFLWQHPLHHPPPAPVIAGNNLYSITLLDSATHSEHSFNRRL
jgi:hypothetical protein